MKKVAKTQEKKTAIKKAPLGSAKPQRKSKIIKRGGGPVFNPYPL